MDPKDLGDSKDQPLVGDEEKQEVTAPELEDTPKQDAEIDNLDVSAEADTGETNDDNPVGVESKSAAGTEEAEDRSAQVINEAPPASPEAAPSIFPAANSAAPSQKKPRKKLFTGLALLVLGILLIAGGAAAAYFGYVVPNKPENVLKDATFNTLQTQRTTFDGDFTVSGGDIPLKAEFVSQADAGAQASNTTVKLTASGVDFSLDLRTIGDDLYVRVGDLSMIESLITSSLTAFGGSTDDTEPIMMLINQASDLLSDQWIEFDSTLLEQGNMQCMTGTPAFTEGDIQLLQDQFSKNPFITIDNHVDESVEGVDTIKFDLTIDNKKGVEYAEGLEELSLVKALEGCGDFSEDIDSEVKPDELLVDDTTKLTVWVDKSEKLIHKVAVADVSLDRDAEEKLSFSTVLTYESFTVEKPENTKPALEVWSELQGLLFGGMDFLNESEFEL